MPVTAKLSREFYEKLGDKVVNELVNLLNLVDANSRSDLRELNEGNFARFDAKVEQRFAESEVRLERRFAEFETRILARLAASEARNDRRFEALEKGAALLREDMQAMGAGLREDMQKMRADLTNRMFLFWSGTIIPLAGLMYVMLHGR